MIGLYNEKQKITSHLTNFVQNRDTVSHEVEELKQKIEKNADEIKLKYSKLENMIFEIEQIKESFKTTVNADDLNELVQDIRTSFELFINNSQTPRQNELEQHLKTLESRISELETHIKSFFVGNEVELITAENAHKEIKKTKIPKLEIRKK